MSFVLAIGNAQAEIEEWYRKGIEKYILNAEAIVLYRVESISLVQNVKIYNIYQVNTSTIRVLKGKALLIPCYTIQFEGVWDQIEQEIGKERIAILDSVNTQGCSFIDNMMNAPGTSEYLKLFESMIKMNSQLNHRSKNELETNSAY